MFKSFFLALVLFLGACATAPAPKPAPPAQLTVTTCTVTEPPKLVKPDELAQPEFMKGADAEGNPIMGIGMIFEINSFNAFGKSILALQSWAKDVYARCGASK